MPAGALVVAAGVAWWRWDTTMLRLLAIVAVGSVVGAWSVASITPPAHPYLFVWLHVLSAVLWGAVVLTACRAVVRVPDRKGGSIPVEDAGAAVARGGRSRRIVAVMLIVGLGVVPAGAAAAVVARSQLPHAEAARAADHLLPAAMAAVSPGEEFSISSNVDVSRIVETLGAQLAEHGRRIVVDADHALAWGANREGDVTDPAVVQLAVLVGAAGEPIPLPQGWTLLDQWEPGRDGRSPDSGVPVALIVRTDT